MPPIFDPDESCSSVESKHLQSSLSVRRKSQTERIYQQDQFNLLKEQDKIKF